MSEKLYITCLFDPPCGWCDGASPTLGQMRGLRVLRYRLLNGCILQANSTIGLKDESN